MPATTRSPRYRPPVPTPADAGDGIGPAMTSCRPRTVEDSLVDPAAGRASRARQRLAAAGAGGLLAAAAIVLAAAAASGASPVSGAAATSTPTALTQQVSYRVQQLHSPDGPGPGGPAAAVIVELLDAAGVNVSGPGITLTVTGLSPRPGPGGAPGGTFTPVNLGLWPCYRLQVSTAGYPPGTYTLSFTAGTDPVTHTAQFTVP